MNAVVENVRNIAAVGALPRAITDCLNYGNPEVPEDLWALEQGVKGITDAANALGEGGEAIPVISGNVSLYNTTKEGPIDPTANVCMIGTMPEAKKAVSMRIKEVGSTLYLLGERKDECGGSAYYQVLESLAGEKRSAFLGKNVPSPDFKEVQKEVSVMTEAIEKQLVSASHDISEGGLLLALFEMMTPARGIGGEIGIAIDVSSLDSKLRTDTLLFSETGGFVLEVPKENVKAFESLSKKHKVNAFKIGTTTKALELTVRRNGSKVLSLNMKELLTLWSESLEKALESA